MQMLCKCSYLKCYSVNNDALFHHAIVFISSHCLEEALPLPPQSCNCLAYPRKYSLPTLLNYKLTSHVTPRTLCPVRFLPTPHNKLPVIIQNLQLFHFPDKVLKKFIRHPVTLPSIKVLQPRHFTWKFFQWLTNYGLHSQEIQIHNVVAFGHNVPETNICDVPAPWHI